MSQCVYREDRASIIRSAKSSPPIYCVVQKLPSSVALKQHLPMQTVVRKLSCHLTVARQVPLLVTGNEEVVQVKAVDNLRPGVAVGLAEAGSRRRSRWGSGGPWALVMALRTFPGTAALLSTRGATRDAVGLTDEGRPELLWG